jgi:16S rRNA processing protein RimM
MLSDVQLINIGFISKPTGFKGELIFAIEDGDPGDYSNSKFFFVELEGKPVPFLAEIIKLNDSSLVVKLGDVNSEAEAKKLSGKKLFVEKSTTTSSEKEMDWFDLVGYFAVDKVYGALGKIEHIEESPQQLIAQCSVNGKVILFPLHEDFISEIDDEKKQLYLDLPEGLLDVYLK